MSARAASGLYLHLPFCSAVCPYCDFAVVKAGAPARRRRFVDRLRAEIELVGGGGGWAETRPFDTVYFGGGTPSLHPPEELEEILAAVRRHLGLAGGAELFLEANPEDVTRESVTAWRRLGVRFLSLGVQSFAPHELALLGRRHTPAEAVQAVERALAAGFTTVSLDLIYGLPGQRPAAWRRNLEQAVALSPHHLSCYQLTVEEGTPFGVRRAKGELAEPGEPVEAELFGLTHRLLADAGYPAYEVSNFAASPAHRSRHNQKYWHHAPYLGLGPSAHSFDGHRRRFWNERRLYRWGQRLAAGERPLAGEETLSDEQLALEALMLGLRTADGIDLAAFARRYGCDLAARNHPRLDELATAGLLELTADRLRPTPAGLAVAEGLAARLEVAM